MADSFGDRVAAAVATTGPLCAGIDPSSSLLEAWGLRDSAQGLRSFCATCVEGFVGVVGVIKPQVAFFERHGSAGLAELERLVADAVAAGLIVIADAKRGDIDSTAAAYADAWLGGASPLAADAMTVHPYLGLGALEPLVHLASDNGKGSRPSRPAARPSRTCSWPRSPSSTVLPRSWPAPWVRWSGPHWSRQVSRCPSSGA
jgi:orotidine-5'-phosphate decarboxylase